MLYLNKPILVLNYDGHPGSFFDFNDKILVNNSNQLLNKISHIEENYNNYNKSLQQLRKKLFFSNIQGNTVKDLLTNFDQKLKK